MVDSKRYDNILDAIGKTPLVKLNRITADLSCEVYAKLEFTNPSGSIIPAPWSTMSVFSPRAKEVATGTPQEIDSMAVNGNRSIRLVITSRSAALNRYGISSRGMTSVIILILS